MADNRPQMTVNSPRLVFWNFKPYFIWLLVRKRTYIINNINIPTSTVLLKKRLEKQIRKPFLKKLLG